jgi:septal ring factor EnvC (AmiA/AmiB activator)
MMEHLGALLPATGLVSIVVVVIGGLFAFRVNRATATRIITETQQIAKNTALSEAKAAIEFSHKALESVKEQCDDCRERLAETAQRLERSENRNHAMEQRMHEADERERKITAALRAMIRVLDQNDPTQIEAAITAARELI